MSDSDPNGSEPSAPESPQTDESAPPAVTPEPPQTDEEAQVSDNKPVAVVKRPQRPRKTAVVRYGLMGLIGEFAHGLEGPPPGGSHMVVRTERGVELGEVITGVCDEKCAAGIGRECLQGYLDANGPEYPFRRDGKVLRPANQQDLIDFRHLESSAKEAAGFCRQQIHEFSLPMKLVAVEHLLGGERIIFYFAAESRVDFRELVRRLASQYRTRIEMRQVGARDEARLVGDYERCGQRCCCQQFLKDLKPVSMRMAKTQKATLDPTKISGRCGRLMCCLRYEDAGYEELRKLLPRRNTWVRTADGVLGRVIETQILTQLVGLAMPDGTTHPVANEEIVERDLPAPKPPEQSSQDRRPPLRAEPRPRPRPRPTRPQPRTEEVSAPGEPKSGDEPPVDEAPAGTEEVETHDRSGEESARPKRRRRRRRKKKPFGEQQDGQPPPEAREAPADQGPPPSASAPATEEATSQEKPSDGKPPGRRRRRRRRKRP